MLFSLRVRRHDKMALATFAAAPMMPISPRRGEFSKVCCVEQSSQDERVYELVKAFLRAQNRRLDTSIPKELDHLEASPYVDENRLLPIAIEIGTLLRSLESQETFSSWSALAPLRISLDRFPGKLKRFRDHLLQISPEVVSTIKAAQLSCAEDDPTSCPIDEREIQALICGLSPTKTYALSHRSSEHPRSIRGSSPQAVLGYIEDALLDLGDALSNSSGSPVDITGPSRHLSKLDSMLADLAVDLEGGEFGEALRLAGVNLFAEKKKAQTLDTEVVANFDAPERTFEWIVGCIGVLSKMTGHLKALSLEYKRLNGPAIHPWLAVATHKLPVDQTFALSAEDLLQQSRYYLAPFFQDGRSVKYGATLISSIANLFEFIYRKPFRINNRSPAEYEADFEKAQKSFIGPRVPNKGRLLGVLDYRINDAMKFTCTTIRTLHLEGILFRHDDHTIGYDAKEHGRHSAPTNYDVKRHQRSFWSSPPYRVRDFELISKIGDIWKHDVSRTREG